MPMTTIFIIAGSVALLIAGAHFALILAIKPRKQRPKNHDTDEPR